MNKDPEHFRVDRKSSHNKCAWKVVMHALHKWEQDVQPSYIRALLPSTAPLRWIKSPSGNCTWFSQDPSSANNVHTQGKKFHISTPKNFVANINTHFHKYSAQRDKDSKIRVLWIKKVFPSPKAVSADFSLEILCIEEINIQKILTKAQTFRRFSILIWKNNTAFWKQIIKLLQWASMC